MWKKIATSPATVFTAIVLAKLALVHAVVFTDAHPLRLFFNLCSVVIFTALIELCAKKRKFLAYNTMNLVFTSIFFAAIMYHKYYGVVVTYRALAQVGQVFQVKASVVSLTDPYYVLMFADILIFIVIYYTRERFKRWMNRSIGWKRGVLAGVLAAVLLISSGNVVANAHIYNEIKKAQNMGLVNYELYEIATAFLPPEKAEGPITLDKIRQVKGIPSLRSYERDYWGMARNRDVIIIQLESLQNFLIDLKVNGEEVTPVLNALSRDHFYFPHLYQQIGQGNTSDTEYLVNTSLYIPPNGAASQIYGDKDLPSLPKLLKRQGYESMTFHTNDVAFWNRDQLYPALGFDAHYDDDFFGEDDLLAFGASDEVLYTKTLPELVDRSEQGQRFYASVIAMSSHHPYFLPDDKIGLELPDKLDDTLVGRYLQAANYADRALGQFIDGLKENGLWDKSLIVIYGDHFGLPLNSMDELDLELLEELNGRPYDYTVMFNVPLIIAVPGQTTGEVFPQVAGQVDMMPTIANLLGISLEDQIHFGQDLLNYTHNLLPKRYYLPTGSFINDEAIVVPGESLEDAEIYPLFADDAVHPPEAVRDAWREQFDRALELLRMSDTFIDSLPSL